MKFIKSFLMITSILLGHQITAMQGEAAKPAVSLQEPQPSSKPAIPTVKHRGLTLHIPLKVKHPFIYEIEIKENPAEIILEGRSALGVTIARKDLLTKEESVHGPHGFSFDDLYQIARSSNWKPQRDPYTYQKK